MHYASHILVRCIALWCVVSSGEAARNVNSEILANFAKNVAAVLSPMILSELQSRNNRSLQSFQAESAILNDGDLDPHSTLNNIVDETPNEATYYEQNLPNSYSYNNIYESSPAELEVPEADRQDPLRSEAYLRHEPPGFYKPYDYSTSNLDVTPKSTDNKNIEPSSIGNVEGSSTSLYPSYYGAGFHKTAFPYGGFHGFGPYGHFHHHHHYPYGDDGSGEASGEENNRHYGNHGYGHPFPYGGYGHGPFYGPYGRNGNSSENGRNGHYGYGYGPYHGGPGFYGHPYGPNHGNNGNNNNNNNNNNNGETSSRQTEEEAGNGEQNNSTKNGYPHFYGPPLLKPVVGPFHGSFPFSFPHYHGVFKGGPVVGVGHVGYPFYADPFLIGFPFHHPYGPFFHGKKYLPPKGKPADSGESGESGEPTETPAGELTEENPERITAPKEVIAPAPNTNRYKTSGRKESKRTS